jgi:ATP-dependent Lon protease
LESEHFGLEEVKERILDHVAVLSLVKEMRGPILCLVGPPGVGKTSLGRSIAGALGREFVRVSLGGIRDEAEIRGHRRTYVGALPGRVIQGMRRSGTRNPVFLLDEVDKLARDFHGDPGAALLEVLDPEQNRTFTDHYLELEYDLSDVLFVATANTLQGIPEPLRDRMEVIRLPGYLDTEKRTIASRFLWPRQAAGHGLADQQISVSPDAIHMVIERYTREAGVRELDRRLSRIARKLARAVADGRPIEKGVETSHLKSLLGPPPYHPTDRDQDGDRIGIATGLAWTASGGEVLDVEVAVVPGNGTLRLTGTLGDVMKESAQAAVTYARSRSRLLGLEPKFHQQIDVHIHIPEGATPKDGPSAGITIAVALISALTDTPTRADVAMTGEITLRGRVLGVGGVKEKAVAALRSGMRCVVLPAANATDLELLPDEVRESVVFELVRTMDEVMDAVLVGRSSPRPHAAEPDLGIRLPHG